MKAFRTQDVARRNVFLGLIAFAAFSIGLTFSPAAGALIFVIPLVSFGIELYLQRRYPAYYVGFTCWLFFLTPMLRRMIEYHVQADTAAFVMIAPFLSCWAGMAVVRDQPVIFDARLRMWVLVAGALLYGTVIGFLSNPISALTQDIFGWSSPMCFALYLFIQRERADELLDSFRKNMLAGAIAMCGYGLVQFFSVRPWDQYWMEHVQLTSIGLPEPMEVRVFSTMNTPQPFADYLVCALLLGLVSKRFIRLVVAPLAILLIGLTMSRSAWVCAAAGMLILAVSMRTRQRFRMVGTILACMVVLFLALQSPGVDDIITHRLESFKTLKYDGSVNDRIANQQLAMNAFQSSPFGLGLGAEGRGAGVGPTYGVPRDSYVLGDNGIEQILLSFGWFGSLMYIIGFAGAVITIFKGEKDPKLLAIRTLLLALIIQSPSMGVFPGASGFLIWSAIGLCFASKYRDSAAARSTALAREWDSGMIREA